MARADARRAQQRLSVLCRQAAPGPPSPGARRTGLSPRPAAAAPALGRALKPSYDYVVVGAGSAGCAVASRLSEDPNVSVLLVEAGSSNQRFAARSTLISTYGLFHGASDWAYYTTPQATTDGRASYWPRGKCLGGSSSINQMLYVRGDPRNYDRWAQRLGCSGWSYEEVLPFFKKSEDLLHAGPLEGPDAGESGVHGRGGPLSVTPIADHSFETREMSELFVRSCQAEGIPTGDFNGRLQRRAALSQVTASRGVRCDAASAFLFRTGAVARPNLTVLADARAMRLTIDGLTATGVALRLAGGATATVGAGREVVLCCGAVGTPQMLMLSGIGPAAHLREHGISCVKDLPVGENLQDHLFWPVHFGLRPGRKAAFAPARPVTGGLLRSVARHLAFGTGLFSLSAVSAMAFEHSRVRGSSEEEANDMQIHYIGFPVDFGKLGEAAGMVPRKDRPLSRPDSGLVPEDGVTFLPTLLLPKSTGSVRLASADPEQHPVIDPCYLSDPRDLEVCVAATRFARRVARAPPLGDVLGPEVRDPSIPHDPESDEYDREYVRRACMTLYHPVGTARMGAADDGSAVVDPRLRVRGVHRLRVADASVMPTIVSGNTNAPSIMIGERLAAFLREEAA